MKKIIYGFLLFAAALSVVSCSESADQTILGYTTDNTLAIVKLNLEQLDKKIPKEQLLQDKTKGFSEEDKKKMKMLLGDDNGIDTGKPVYLLVDREGEEYAMSFFAWLDDKDKFATTFSEISGGKVKVTVKDDYIYADNELAGSIKGDMMIFAFSMDDPIKSMGAPSGGSAPKSFYTAFWEREQTEDDNRIAQIEKSLEGNADMSVWVDVYSIVRIASRKFIDSLSIKSLIEGAGVGGSLSFEKGKIEVKTNTFLNDEMQKLMEEYYDDKTIDYGIVKNIELDNAKAFGLGNTSFEMVKYFVKESGFEGMADSYLEGVGLTFEEACNAFNGKYVYVSYKDSEIEEEADTLEETVAVTEGEEDYESYEDEEDYEGYEDVYDDYDRYKYSQPNFLVALGINGSKAQKIIDLVKSQPAVSSMYKVWNNKELLVVCTREKDLELLKANKAANNKVLDKKSGLQGYTWTSGEDYTNMMGLTGGPKVNIKGMETESKIEDGNFTSLITVTLDKDKENALYYIMGYE